MAHAIADRIKETTSTTGTGTLDLNGSSTGYQSFVAGVGSGNTTYYAITDGADWEVGQGTVTAGTPDTLSRTTVIASSNSNAKVSWGTGAKDVFCTAPAAKLLTTDALNQVLLSADGSASVPALARATDTNTGLFFPSADELGVAVGGAEVFRAASGVLQLTNRIETDTDTVQQTQNVTASGGTVTFPTLVVPAHGVALLSVSVSGPFYEYRGLWVSLEHSSSDYDRSELFKHRFQQAGGLTLAITDSGTTLTPALTIAAGGSGSNGTHTCTIRTLVLG